MKTNKYQRRFYRDWVNSKSLYLSHIVVEETDLQIFSNKILDKDFVKNKINSYRRDIEGYIAKDRRFLTTLKPIAVELHAAPIVKKMAEAACLANVGPMAAVAGAIAEFLGRGLLRKGYKDIIIENGGDIFLAVRKNYRIGIYAGESFRLSKGLKLKIRPEDTPLGVCTSSGSVGHSLSFGLADAVTILSKNASLADAAATAVANRVKSAQDLQKAVDFAKSIKGVSGVVIIIKGCLASWGRVEFVT
ncbi:MAG: UPF0280 family protein [Candidatus Omnitrophica bacterium]|nr:UPF0280 family protein [Candidatus Omnitrophota bacterium]MDD5592550.1 UPF0280 family protein [Candidatus Omnitrophota bacterium]